MFGNTKGEGGRGRGKKLNMIYSDKGVGVGGPKLSHFLEDGICEEPHILFQRANHKFFTAWDAKSETKLPGNPMVKQIYSLYK